MTRVAIVLLTLAFVGSGCRRGESPPARAAKPTNVVTLTPEGIVNGEVRWQRVEPGSFVPRLRLTGSISGDPTHIAQVGARVPGRVSAIRVHLGDEVRRGQPIVEIDAIELHQVELEYRTAQAKIRAARDALARQQQLVDERVGALQDLRRSQADVATQEATLHEADEHLHLLGLSDREIDRFQSTSADGEASSRIASPINGHVTALPITLGQALTGNETVATIADIASLWATIPVPERDLNQITTGTDIEIRVPTYPDRAFRARVSFVSEVLDPVSRSAEVRALVDDPTTALRPGMSAVALVPEQHFAGVWLPIEAVQKHDGADCVFVRVGEGRFEARPVRVGPEDGGFVPMLEGVGANDEIVVHGAFALRGELERAELE